MSVAEMKIEVINKITSLNSETVLQEVLTLLNNVSEKEYDLLPHVESIVSEREAVLKKLAH